MLKEKKITKGADKEDEHLSCQGSQRKRSFFLTFCFGADVPELKPKKIIKFFTSFTLKK